jgi:hypothetical protein
MLHAEGLFKDFIGRFDLQHEVVKVFVITFGLIVIQEKVRFNQDYSSDAKCVIDVFECFVCAVESGQDIVFEQLSFFFSN